VKNEWSCSSSPPIQLRDVARDSSTSHLVNFSICIASSYSMP